MYICINKINLLPNYFLEEKMITGITFSVRCNLFIASILLLITTETKSLFVY